MEENLDMKFKQKIRVAIDSPAGAGAGTTTLTCDAVKKNQNTGEWRIVMSDICDTGIATLHPVEVGRADELREIKIVSSSSKIATVAPDGTSLSVPVTKGKDLCIDIILSKQANAINFQPKVQIAGSK